MLILISAYGTHTNVFKLVEWKLVAFPLASARVCGPWVGNVLSGVSGGHPAADVSGADVRSYTLNNYGRTCLNGNSQAFRNWSISVCPIYFKFNSRRKQRTKCITVCLHKSLLHPHPESYMAKAV